MLLTQLTNNNQIGEDIDADKAMHLLATMDQLTEEDIDSLLDDLMGDIKNER